VVVASLVALVLGGCGDDDSGGATPSGDGNTEAASASELTPNETTKVARVNLAFARTVLDGSEYGRTLNGVDYLIRLCRAKPDAIYQPGDKGEKRTMRQVVEDGANTLRQYQPDLAAQLQTVSDNNCA
jgi:hypothetical protein